MVDDRVVDDLGIRERYADWRSRLGVLLALVIAVAILVASFRIYFSFTDAPEMVPLELAGSAAAARDTLGASCAGDAACVTRYAAALYLDVLLIIGYVVALVTVGAVARRYCAGPAAKQLGRLVVVATAVVALCDVVEDVAIGRGLAGMPLPASDTPWRVAAAAAAVKFSVALPTALIAAGLVVVIIARCVLPAGDYRWTREGDRPVRPALPAGAAPATDPERSLPPGRTPGGLSVCVSGGGIRAACVALGALQVLRADPRIGSRWKYLFSVSGGGYTTGALRIASDFSEPPGPGTYDGRLLGPGSPEESYLRRHGRYVADSAPEWLRALATVFRNLLISLGLLVAAACATGTVLGAFYATFPIGTYPLNVTGPDPRPGVFRDAAVAVGPVIAVAVLVVLWIVSAIAHGGVRAFSGTPRLGWSTVTAAFGLGAALVAVLGLGVPTVAVLINMGYVALHGDSALDPTLDPLVSGGGAGTVLLTYLGALGAIAWRQRARIGGVRKLLGGSGGVTARVGNGVLLTALVWVVLAVLAVAGLFLATITLTDTARFVETRFQAPGTWLVAAWTLIGLAVLVSLLIDQTSLSMHPFYRRRLAGIVAVRRTAEGLADNVDYRTPTTLSTHADGSGPQTVFCCAAELSGPSRTPPGARAAGFTMSHDWVGGPQVGWLSTADLERRTRAAFAGDATVLGAVAISGAAVASAMGSQSSSYQKLLTLSNVRLGAWLPNPDWLAARESTPTWQEPRLPRVRRITCLLRELVGRYSDKDRLLLVTDGGHYDNLGLVEALRHRPDTVIVVDASGDAPPMATTLAQAIALARDELGVVVDLEHPDRLVPGGATVAGPAALSSLRERLSADVAVEGSIRYPGLHAPVGRLIVVKSRLTADMPYELLAYANGHAEFPYDSTADQWFDHGQFDAYRLLGEQLGRRAVALNANAGTSVTQPAGSLRSSSTRARPRTAPSPASSRHHGSTTRTR